ncbi:sulfotransferase family cytosolic 2B member 1 [Pelobates cultripes]|uniref:Sulfotransferase n=1 Tax=Pelobates cultripes TaxID=61616 RepID=A0AAD1T4Y1_PELCU|nr:sulfotransferase family cytosolic 2B member 1 [Pelobates cultripes]
METRLDYLADAHNAITDRLQEMEDTITAQNVKLADLEDRSRRNNIRISGIPETVLAPDLQQYLQDLFQTLKPEIHPDQLIVDRVHRLGRPNHLPPTAARDVIARIHFFHSKERIMKACVIYTGRNPKDVLVSLYHFAIISFVLKTPHSFDEFFEDFIQAKVPFGSWFDHIKGWMQMKDHDNFLFITFEELKKDHRGTIKKICTFLGKELSKEAIDLVVEHSSFKTMKENKMSNHSLAPEFIMKKNSNFIRKGKNY